MKIAICLDDNNGMMFAGRRQSMDCVLRQNLLEMTEDARLWMNAYSAAQFTEPSDRIMVDEDFLQKAKDGDWCFVENGNLTQIAGSVTRIAIYRWNRVYPSDVKFPVALFRDRWKLMETREFPGKSHPCITREVYDL